MIKLHASFLGIEALASIARWQNYSDASRELGISVPGLAQRINRLEKKLSRALVAPRKQDGRRRELTLDGALLVEAMGPLHRLVAKIAELNLPERQLLLELQNENALLKQLLVETLLENMSLRTIDTRSGEDMQPTQNLEATVLHRRKAAALAKVEARALARRRGH